jgi:hypothetical protein
MKHWGLVPTSWPFTLQNKSNLWRWKKLFVTLEAKNRSKGFKISPIPQVFLASTPRLLQSPTLKVIKTLQTRARWNWWNALNICRLLEYEYIILLQILPRQKSEPSKASPGYPAQVCHFLSLVSKIYYLDMVAFDCTPRFFWVCG